MRMFELYRIAGCVEPVRVGGPYQNYSDLLAAARREHEKCDAADLLLAARVDGSGRIVLASFSAAGLAPDIKPTK